MCRLLVIAFVLAQVCAASVYKGLRYDEDFSYLRDPAQRDDLFDPLKFITLNRDRTAFLTLGGDARLRYEFFTNPGWGRGLEDRDGYMLQRYLLHADLRVANSVRLFTQVQSSLISDRRGGPRATDKDILDLHQAFVDFNLPISEPVTFRFGRQEIAYGSSRILSFREGPNNRLSFDGAKVLTKLSAARVDLFALRPVETNPDIFDDGPDPNQNLWGVYSVVPLPFRGAAADFYYLGLERDRAQFVQGIGRELRHTFGSRLSGRLGSLDYNFEFIYQAGSFGRGDICAWTAASDQGYTFTNAPWQPRLGVKANITSGDKDASDPDLETFNPLFPRGAYFGEPALVGPANHIDLHPALDLKPTEKITITLDWDVFWRASADDGIYGPGVNVLVPPAGSSERFVGHQVQGLLEWRVQRHLALTCVYARFFAGDFLKETTPGQDVDYVSAWMAFRF